MPTIPVCPHCGLRVLFEADGTCPSCGRPKDAPVTDEDLDRIDRERAEAERRSREEPFRPPEIREEEDRSPWVVAFLTLVMAPVTGYAVSALLGLLVLGSFVGCAGRTLFDLFG